MLSLKKCLYRKSFLSFKVLKVLGLSCEIDAGLDSSLTLGVRVAIWIPLHLKKDS
jgi:hypothetical protein